VGSTFYLFYMVLFTGGVLWCLFLWLARDDEEEKEGGGDRPDVENPSAASARDRPAPPPASLPPAEK
jgi:hypothetical protein